MKGISDMRALQTKENGMVIPHLGILVTTYCNLNCRNCADLIPRRCNVHYKLEDIKSDLSIILNSVSFIDEVLVIGGETLLYPQLQEVLDFCGTQSKIGKTIITTNGTIYPDKKLEKCLQKNKVMMRVSGYPKEVAPRRDEIVKQYQDAGLAVDDLKGMRWMDIGSSECRNRTATEMREVFHSCSMAQCVSLQKDGKIFYCSRSISAYETDLYPTPLRSEYIDVRHSENLEEAFREFYNLEYISTCNYCDGISCISKQLIPAAVQILDKEVFLTLAQAACDSQENAALDERVLAGVVELLIQNKDRLKDIAAYAEVLRALQALGLEQTKENAEKLKICLRRLVNDLAEDYIYRIDDAVVGARKSAGKEGVSERNVITVGDVNGGCTEDLLVSEEELQEKLYLLYPVDGMVYNRMFIESRLRRLAEEPVTCAVCGLSYTQYGILEQQMPFDTVNLSVTGQDIPYSLLMAEKALEINSGLKKFVIPMTYYQGFYDISADQTWLHEEVTSRVNVPVLGNARNFNGTCYEEGYEERTCDLALYDKIVDFKKLRRMRDEKLCQVLAHREYFNSIFPEPAYGGLKFDFHLLSEEEKYLSAKKTAELNERVVTDAGYREVLHYMREILPRIAEQGRKVTFFVPPMTKYLYAAYSQDLKQNFKHKILPVFAELEQVEFVDLSCDDRFTDEDFADFEHLNSKGAQKLTKIIGEIA